MPRTRKTLLKQNLYKLPVLIVDTGVESTYFNIKQLSGVFTGGKNAFLISGTELLKPGTEILIELLDSNGNSIYVEAIRGFVEANARLVVIEVYPDTAPGAAVLTIMGTAAKTRDGRLLSEKQTEKPNTRWQKRIIIEPRNKNTTPIRIKKAPELYVVEELLNPFEFSQSIVSNSNSIFKLKPKFELTKQKGYTVKIKTPNVFSTSSRLYNPVLTGSLLVENRLYTYDIPFTTSSYAVQNFYTTSVNLPLSIIKSTTAYTDKNLVTSTDNKIVNVQLLFSGSYEVTESQYSSSNGTKYFVSMSSITSSTTYQYVQIPEITIVGGKKSFARCKLINLDTVSGEISRIKTSFRRAESNDEFAFLSDTPLQINELLVSESSNTYERQKPIGIFDDGISATTLQNNWYSFKITGSSTPDPAYFSSSVSSAYHNTLYPDSTLLINAAYASASANNYFFGTKENYSLVSTSEYTLKFDAVVTSSIETNISTAPNFNLDIYLIGSSIVDKNPLGKLIGNINKKANNILSFNNNIFNFKVPRDGSVGIRFVPKNGHWQFSNISLKVADEFAFNPDEIIFYVPIATIVSESIIVKAELFDINNNSINLNVTSTPTYFTGSTV